MNKSSKIGLCIFDESHTFPIQDCIDKLEFYADKDITTPLFFPITIRGNNKISNDFGFFNKKINIIDEKK